jgi:exopolysaccharide biosynthesis polyprenyl glycosylphosphotransferase
MSTSEFWQRVSDSVSPSSAKATGVASPPGRGSSALARLWITLDGITIFGAAALATLFVNHTGLVAGAKGFWDGTLFHGRSMYMLLALVFEFAVALMLISRKLNLYYPARITSLLREQRLSLQACLTSGLLLAATLYLIHASDIRRSVVLITVAIVAVALSVRRLVYRVQLYRRFHRGEGTRNVLIVGTGAEAHALRHHLESMPHLGYTFKGFVDFPGSNLRYTSAAGDVVDTFDSLFQSARKHFADEIFLTSACEPAVVQEVLEHARAHRVDLRVVPDIYNGLAWNSTIEYIGQFPTIPLHSNTVPEVALLFKRIFDFLFSGIVLLLLSPFLLAVAIAIKMDSPGPVFYYSDRIGKKGRVFRCIKFRTMVSDAERRKAEIAHMNERDGVLFKVTNDPRITKLGRILRKFSIDELPQFINVFRGEMSIVGPRPPLASEVKEYKITHLRRLDVMPGVTGLWQVVGRKDPSFDSYISLDVTYIEHWSLWLDVKIIVRTVGVVVAGTGT